MCVLVLRVSFIPHSLLRLSARLTISFFVLGAGVVPRVSADLVASPVVVNLFENATGSSWPAACSDGRRLAYMRGINKSSEIFISDISDTTAKPIQVTDSPKWDGKPSWSPDCKRIAFMSGRSGNEDIWTYTVSTGEFTQMTFSHEGNGIRAQEWGPAWSPDGTRIAFSSDRSGDDDIWRVPAEGGEPVRITKRTLARERDQERYPTWSPDGKRLMFASKTSGNWDLWVVSVDDTSAAPVQVTADTTDEWSPAWSPNGRWVAFCSTRTGNLDIFVMPADGGSAVPVTSNAGEDNTPGWSADGKRLFYSASRAEEVGIWAIDGLEEVLGSDFASRQ